MLILASQSVSRRAMLTAAGIPHQAMAAGVDEDGMKLALRGEGHDARALADALAELKATKLSRRHPQDLVLGCDSTVVLNDGTMIDKTSTREESRAQLQLLRGQRHRLYSAAVMCQAGAPIWRFVDVAKMHMRDFSDDFIDTYLDAEWPAIGGCVGGYRIEGLGAQLFAKIEGSQFTIQGLPLLPLLDYLRTRGVMAV